MTVAELIGKLRTKKRAAERSSFSHYRELIRSLASGAEADSDEVGAVLDATGKDESDLERDVSLQQERNGRYAQLTANRQAAADRIAAERELQAAQEKLQRAHDELMPAISAAASRLQMLDQAMIHTSAAEAWLAENVVDVDLLAREAAVVKDLRAISQELTPLESDRTRKQTYLSNLESRLDDLQSSAAGPWMQHVVAPWLGRVNADIRVIESRISDVRNELRQLDSAIRQRQSTQARLQTEMAEIHRQKLQP